MARRSVYGRKFVARQQHFQLAQLRPFAAILFEPFKGIYEGLLSKQREPTDDDYAPYSSGEAKTGGSRSPKSTNELAAMGDTELIEYMKCMGRRPSRP